MTRACSINWITLNVQFTLMKFRKYKEQLTNVTFLVCENFRLVDRNHKLIFQKRIIIIPLQLSLYLAATSLSYFAGSQLLLKRRDTVHVPC